MVECIALRTCKREITDSISVVVYALLGLIPAFYQYRAHFCLGSPLKVSVMTIVTALQRHTGPRGTRVPKWRMYGRARTPRRTINAFLRTAGSIPFKRHPERSLRRFHRLRERPADPSIVASSASPSPSEV